MSASSPPSESGDPRSSHHTPGYVLFEDYDDDDDMEFHPGGDSDEEDDAEDASYHGAICSRKYELYVMILTGLRRCPRGP